MFNIIRHCENERAKNTIEYKRFKTGTNDPTITRRKRFAQLMKSSKTARIHNFQERLSKGTIFVASQGQHANDYPSYRYASGQVASIITAKDPVETTYDDTNNEGGNANNAQLGKASDHIVDVSSIISMLAFLIITILN